MINYGCDAVGLENRRSSTTRKLQYLRCLRRSRSQYDLYLRSNREILLIFCKLDASGDSSLTSLVQLDLLD